MQMLILSSLSS